MCPNTISPASLQQPVVDDGDGDIPELVEADTDDEELADMETALKAGKGFDGGANISEGVICGPSDGSGPLAQKPMLLRGPCDPTQNMIDVHHLTHLPYMNWCPHCVATRRPNVAHTTSKAVSTIP